MNPLNDAENYTRPSDVDDFATHAENYLAPRHHVPSVIDKVNDDEAMAAREKLTADTDAIVGGLSKNAPPRADYDYEEAVGGGQLFKPKEDGSIDYPNAHIKAGKRNVAGFDFGSGKKVFTTYADGEGLVDESVKRLMESTTNDQTGPDMADQQATARIAITAQEEGFSFEQFTDSMKERGYTPEMLHPSWRAAGQARIATLYSRNPDDFPAEMENPVEIEQGYTEDDLRYNENFMNDAATFYESLEGEVFMGNGDDLHAYIVDNMSRLTSPSWGGVLLARTLNGTSEFNDAFYRVLMAYRATENDWGQVGRAAAYNVADPTNLVGLTGVGLAASAATKAAMKQTLSKFIAITAAARQGAKVAAAEGGAYATLDDFYAQEVGMRTGEDYDLAQGATAAATGVAGGTALGGAVGTALSEPAQAFYKKLLRKGRESMDTQLPVGVAE